MLDAALHHRRFALAHRAAAIGVASLGLVFVVGTDFFPSVDAGLMKLHFRAPTGSRIEETEQLVDAGRERHPRHHSRATSSRPSTP